MNNLPQRKKIRLTGYDYSTAGAYFITICTKNKEYLFGNIADGNMALSPVGVKALEFWLAIVGHNPIVQLGEFVIMPNHLHGILILKETASENWRENSFSKPASGSISTIINQYKAAVKRWCNKNGHEDFYWQPRFYEHVIRNDESYNKIHHYIATNIENWDKDTLKSRNSKL